MVLHKNTIVCFIGTYTDKSSEGIYRINFNTTDKKIEKFNLAYKIGNPTYFAIDRERHILYSPCKINDEAGVSSFKYWQEQDSLNLVNYNVSEKAQPCHLSTDSDKQILISSNYHENKMIVYNTLEGIILNYPLIGRNEGKGVSKRQDGPHIHCSMLTRDNKYILCVDLGIDKIVVYEMNGNKLEQRMDLSYSFPDGTGPRHVVYSAITDYYYVISELTSEIFVLKYSPKDNSLFEHVQTISSVSPDYDGDKSGAAIRIHPSNKFLYTSDRGNNSLNLFSISSDSTLKFLKSFSCNGESPRDFQITPDGNFLFCANEKSNNIAIFSINRATGELTFITSQKVDSPTAVEFA